MTELKRTDNSKLSGSASALRILLTLSVGAALSSPSVWAQGQVPDQAIDLAGIRAQLEENSKSHPAETGSKAQLETEDQRLAEQ